MDRAEKQSHIDSSRDVTAPAIPKSEAVLPTNDFHQRLSATLQESTNTDQESIDEMASSVVSCTRVDLDMLKSKIERAKKTTSIKPELVKEIASAHKNLQNEYRKIPLELRATFEHITLRDFNFKKYIDCKPESIDPQQALNKMMDDIKYEIQILDGMHAAMTIWQWEHVSFNDEARYIQALQASEKQYEVKQRDKKRAIASFRNSRIMLGLQVKEGKDIAELHHEIAANKNGFFSIRFSPTGLLGVLTSGQIKNWNDFRDEQHHPQGSAIRSQPSERRDTEEALGFSENGRVAYGVYELARDAHKQHHYKNGYGECEMRFRIADIGDNVSMTMGDSLNGHRSTVMIKDIYRRMMNAGEGFDEDTRGSVRGNFAIGRQFIPEHASIPFTFAEKYLREGGNPDDTFLEMQAPINQCAPDKIDVVNFAMTEDQYQANRYGLIAEITAECQKLNIPLHIEIVPPEKARAHLSGNW